MNNQPKTTPTDLLANFKAEILAKFNGQEPQTFGQVASSVGGYIFDIAQSLSELVQTGQLAYETIDGIEFWSVPLNNQPKTYFTPGQVVKDQAGNLFTVVYGNDHKTDMMTVRPWDKTQDVTDVDSSLFTLTDQELTIEQILEQVHNLAISAEFVPWSRSKYREPNKLNPEPRPGLSWKVTITRNGRNAIITDYYQGIGHIPNDWGNSKKPWAHRERTWIVQTGTYPVYKPSDVQAGYDFDRNMRPKSKPLPIPTLAEVMYCLVLDSNVLNAGGFENWASEYGYDTDSISVKRMYDMIVEQSLVIKDPGVNLDQLSELFQDY